jgi:transmembrane protein EpsG
MLLALRYQVGVDYNSYSSVYTAISRYGLFESVPLYYTVWLGNGFVYFCKFIALFFGEGFLWYHAVLAALSILFLYMAIFQNSKMPLLSLFIYLCDGYYYQIFNQSRQGLAILIVFFSYKYIFESRLMPFVLTVSAASLIHPSALVFLPAFLLAKRKFSMKTVLIFAVAGLILTSGWRIVEGMTTLTRYGHYMNSDQDVAGVDTTFVRAIYRIGIFACCLLFRKSVMQKYPGVVNCLYILCAASLVLQMMSLQSYIFARLVLYYYIGILLLIPGVVKSIGGKEQMIVVLALIVIFASAHIYYFMNMADTLLAPVYRTFLLE